VVTAAVTAATVAHRRGRRGRCSFMRDLLLASLPDITAVTIGSPGKGVQIV
jgi:hypothetical protein